jgi:hypothetical protein
MVSAGHPLTRRTCSESGPHSHSWAKPGGALRRRSTCTSARLAREPRAADTARLRPRSAARRALMRCASLCPATRSRAS